MAHARNKILCIEDDRETVALIAEELVERGFEVSIARNGQEGLLAILKDKPDLVLCDISMPMMSGFEVLERLTDVAPQLGHIPFVFLTALTDRDNELMRRNELPLCATSGREQMQQMPCAEDRVIPAAGTVRLLRQSLLRSPSAETTIWFHSALSFV